MAGEELASFDLKLERLDHVGVKEAVFPFARFPGVDTVLGPEMRSTGEVMGIDRSFEVAFAKSQLGAGSRPPTSGAVFVSVRDADKENQRYESVMAWHPEKKALYEITFAFDGAISEYLIESKDADTLHIGWEPFRADKPSNAPGATTMPPPLSMDLNFVVARTCVVSIAGRAPSYRLHRRAAARRRRA